MFKYLLSAVIALTMLATNPALAGVENSAHDLSATATEEICVYCHTPHNASNVGAPLWNRTATLQAFTMYTSPTATMVKQASPQGVSLACLSCHDGTIAYNSVANAGSGVTNIGTMTSPAAVGSGGNLADDHPISIKYDPTVDTAFNVATTGKVNGTLPLYGASSDQVECATCHDPHDAAGTVKFLRVANTQSALCSTCHIK